MTKRTAHRARVPGILLVAVVLLALPASALADVDSGWRLRFQATSIDFHNNAEGVGRGSGYDVDVGAGVGVNAEYRFSRRLGVDLGALAGVGVDVYARTVHVDGTTLWVHDTLSFTPITAGLDIHLTPDSRVDVYLCPLLAWVRYGGLVVHTGTHRVITAVDIDDDFAVGAALGVGVPFGTRQRWSFNASLMHLDSQLDGTGSDGYLLDGDYDATVLGLGFGYRF